MNPEETRFRYPYASYALRAEQWQDFDDQIKSLQRRELDFNYGYFGGEETFQKTIALMNERLGRK